MALGDNLGNRLSKPNSTKTQTRERRPIKTSRIKYIIISAILFAAALFLLIFMLWAKGGMDIGSDEHTADNLYSASRYFCRVKYPDNWDVTAGDNGFYMNKDTGLIFQLYRRSGETGTGRGRYAASGYTGTFEDTNRRRAGFRILSCCS